MKRRFLAAAVFLSFAWTTAPALLQLAREAGALRKLPLHERRARVTNGFSRATAEVVASAKPGERLALMSRYDHPGESDAAVFFNYYAYPQPTRTYIGLQPYAVDADPHRPKTLVAFSGAPHRTTYAALRAESMTGPTVVRDLQPSADARRELIVPFVASIDGPPPDTYTVEAVFAADARATVEATMYPSGATQRFIVDGRRVMHDLGYAVSRDMGLGWMRVRSDIPIRAGFWLVNRGTGASTRIAIVDSLPPLPIRFPARPSAHLWLLNVDDQELLACADGVGARIPPHGLIRMEARSVITAPRPLFAFLAEKKERGGTEFIWP